MMCYISATGRSLLTPEQMLKLRPREASDVKAYKANPEAFKGHVGDISGFLRIAITGRQNSPDLYEITQILGYDRTIERVKAAIDML